jgi:hypothetical protein
MEKVGFRKHEYCKYNQYFAAIKEDDAEDSQAAKGWTLVLSFLRFSCFSLSHALGKELPFHPVRGSLA